VVTTNISRMIAVAIGLGFVALMPARALAHCDGLDGPVVKAALGPAKERRSRASSQRAVIWGRRFRRRTKPFALARSTRSATY